MRLCLRIPAPAAAPLVFFLAFGLMALGVASPGRAAEAEAAAADPPVAEGPPAGEGAVAAEEPTEEAAASGEEAAEAEAVAAGEEVPVAGEEEAAAPAPESVPHTVTLGPIGRDVEGRVGRVHTVAKGDTLWDISDAYLGTPWVWPSVWRENPKVENPHRIYPGDRLWIAPGEMRRVTDAEAEALLAAAPETEAPPASIDAPATASGEIDASPKPPPTVRVAIREEAGIITDDRLRGASSVVDSPRVRTWLGSMDDVFIGLGEGAVEVGDQFQVFRARERVYDPRTGNAIGWQMNVLGWVEVKEVHEEVARAEVRMAYAEMRVGDRVLPRERMPEEIPLRAGPPGLEGQIVLMSDDRFTGSGNDLVYVDRGRNHGLEVGSVLQVYRPVGEVREPVQDVSVQVPARVLGELVVVRVDAGSATAIVRRATRELEIGDRVRGAEL